MVANISPRFVEMISNFLLVRANKHRDDGVHQTLKDTLGFRKLRVIRPECLGVDRVRGVVKIRRQCPVFGPLTILWKELVRGKMPHLLHRTEHPPEDESAQALDAHIYLQDLQQFPVRTPIVGGFSSFTSRGHGDVVPTNPRVVVVVTV